MAAAPADAAKFGPELPPGMAVPTTPAAAAAGGGAGGGAGASSSVGATAAATKKGVTMAAGNDINHRVNPTPFSLQASSHTRSTHNHHRQGHAWQMPVTATVAATRMAAMMPHQALVLWQQLVVDITMSPRATTSTITTAKPL